MVRPIPRAALVLILLAGLLAGCAGVGGPKAGAPTHHAEGGFRNPNPGYVPAPAWVRAKFFLSRIWATTFHPRTAALPRVENDGAALRENPAKDTVTLGTRRFSFSWTA